MRNMRNPRIQNNQTPQEKEKTMTNLIKTPPTEKQNFTEIYTTDETKAIWQSNNPNHLYIIAPFLIDPEQIELEDAKQLRDSLTAVIAEAEKETN